MLGSPSGHRRSQVRLVLRALGRVLRHGEKSPALGAALKIVGRDIAARSRKVAAAVADDDGVPGEQRCAAQGVRLVLAAPDQGIDFPQPLPVARVYRMQPAVQGADIHAPVEHGEPAVHGITTGIPSPLSVDFRIVGP